MVVGGYGDCCSTDIEEHGSQERSGTEKYGSQKCSDIDAAGLRTFGNRQSLTLHRALFDNRAKFLVV